MLSSYANFLQCLATTYIFFLIPDVCKIVVGQLDTVAKPFCRNKRKNSFHKEIVEYVHIFINLKINFTAVVNQKQNKNLKKRQRYSDVILSVLELNPWLIPKI